MINGFLQSLCTLPLTYLLACALCNLKYSFKKCAALALPFLCFTWFAELAMAFGGCTYEQIIGYSFFIAFLPLFACFWMLSKNRGPYLLFACLNVWTLSALCNSAACLISLSFNGDIPVRLILHISFLLCIIFYVWKFLREPSLYLSRDIPASYWPACLLYPVLLTVLLYLPSFGSRAPGEKKFIPYLPAGAPDELLYWAFGILTVLSVYLFTGSVYHCLNREQRDNQNKQLFMLQLDSVKRQCKIYASNVYAQRLRCNELRQKYDALSKMLCEKHIDEAHYYLTHELKKANELHPELYCRDLLVNAALSLYFARAKAEGIDLVSNLFFQEPLAVSGPDLAVLFANVLDNAIFAVISLPAEQRKIHLLLHSQNGCLTFKVSNPCHGTIPMRKGRPYHSNMRYGLGARSIEYFEIKYNALVNYEISENDFQLQIVVPAPTKKTDNNKKTGHFL